MDIQQKIFSLCTSAGLPAALSKFIVCQAIHETGNFSSPVFHDNNNLFGYSFVMGAKWQGVVNTGHRDGVVKYAYYDNIDNSIHEIIDYYKRRIAQGYHFNEPDLTIPLFVSELKRAGYYGDTVQHYQSGVMNAYNNVLDTDIRITLDTVNISIPKKKVCSCCGRPL